MSGHSVKAPRLQAVPDRPDHNGLLRCPSCLEPHTSRLCGLTDAGWFRLACDGCEHVYTYPPLAREPLQPIQDVARMIASGAEFQPEDAVRVARELLATWGLRP